MYIYIYKTILCIFAHTIFLCTQAEHCEHRPLTLSRNTGYDQNVWRDFGEVEQLSGNWRSSSVFMSAEKVIKHKVYTREILKMGLYMDLFFNVQVVPESR